MKKNDFDNIPFEELVNQNKKLTLIIRLIILFLLILLIILFTFKKNLMLTKFYLKGDPIINIKFGEKYKDDGFVAKIYNKDISKRVIVKNNINYNKIGKYKITYTIKIKYLNIDKTLIRKININDAIPPELTVNSESEIYLDQNDTYARPTYKAVDNVDGDITKKVKVESNLDTKKVGEYKEVFSVKDSSNNETKKEIKIIVQEKFKNTYINISISKQVLEYYVKNKLVLQTDVVTGRNGDTPYGTYSILNKKRNARLVGDINPRTNRPSYDTHVNYWMAFIGNSHGLHDATWRRNFGGNTYTYDPTHGCVNIPYDAMAKLFDMVEVGTPVYIVK